MFFLLPLACRAAASRPWWDNIENFAIDFDVVLFSPPLSFLLAVTLQPSGWSVNISVFHRPSGAPARRFGDFNLLPWAVRRPLRTFINPTL